MALRQVIPAQADLVPYYLMAEKRKNSAIFVIHNASAKRLIAAVAKGAWFSAKAKMPVPIVAVNQFGVKLRIASLKGAPWDLLSEELRNAIGVDMEDSEIFSMIFG